MVIFLLEGKVTQCCAGGNKSQKNIMDLQKKSNSLV